MLKVRMMSGTEVVFYDRNNYRRRNSSGIVREHQCLLWGAVLPMGPGDAVGSGLILAVPDRHGRAIPVKIVPFKVVEGAPLAFVQTRNVNGELQLVFHCSSPVIEYEGKPDEDETPDGKVVPLDPNIAKLLFEDGGMKDKEEKPEA